MSRELSFIINTGSTSKKYAIFNKDDQGLYFACFEKNKSYTLITHKIGDNKEEQKKITEDQFQQSTSLFLQLLLETQIIEQASDIKVVGIRVVAPGSYFNQTRLVDDQFKKKLMNIKDVASLHITMFLHELDQCAHFFSHIPVVATSDSSFHTSLPEHARLYAIAMDDIQKLDIYRFGYHGISVRSVIRKIKRKSGEIPENIIVCHLGGGSSITAVKKGRSIDTSMGFSPIEGIPMETRVGSFDPGALLYLGKQCNYTWDQLSHYLTTQSGLLGLSGKSSDMRELLTLEEHGDKGVQRALEVFIYNIQKQIGAYYVALGGLDLLVFTGTIGERSPVIRSRVCQGLRALDIGIDDEKNKALVGNDGLFQSDVSVVNVAVMTTHEMYEIALQTKNFYQKKRYSA